MGADATERPDRPAAGGDIAGHRILILDFGSQYSRLIARRVRELGVYCELLPWDVTADEIRAFGADGVILSGGPESVTDGDSAPQLNTAILDAGVPVLGICYGMQALVSHFGGDVEGARQREFGYARVRLTAESQLLDGLDTPDDSGSTAGLDVWMSHGDRVRSLPDGFQVLAATDAAPYAAVGDESRRCYGLQFHPEVTHTPQGLAILARFVHDLCGCEANWTPGNIIADHVESLRRRIGDERVLLGLSGGVDSSVVAALLHEAIGEQVTCIFVDTGLLRYREAEQVMETFARHMGVKVIRVDAAERFMAALAGVTDPEEKRKIIGREFIAVFEEQARKLADVRWLAQGTIYPDVIESAGSRTGKARVIKSHHNVGGLPEEMNLKLVEPLRDLFKDEVREIGVALGLPEAMVYRHPFPGPGLGVRILGEVRPEYAETLALADHLFIEALRRDGLYDKVSQAFAVFLPVRAVGVAGDKRVYEHVIALRAVETVDFMTAHWARLPGDFLDEVSRRIVNEIPGIARVVYDISGKPPATIEWE